MYIQCLEKLPDNRFWELEIDSFHFPVDTSCRNADADIIFLFLFFQTFQQTRTMKRASVIFCFSLQELSIDVLTALIPHMPKG